MQTLRTGTPCASQGLGSAWHRVGSHCALWEWAKDDNFPVSASGRRSPSMLFSDIPQALGSSSEFPLGSRPWLCAHEDFTCCLQRHLSGKWVAQSQGCIWSRRPRANDLNGTLGLRDHSTRCHPQRPVPFAPAGRRPQDLWKALRLEALPNFFTERQLRGLLHFLNNSNKAAVLLLATREPSRTLIRLQTQARVGCAFEVWQRMLTDTSQESSLSKQPFGSELFQIFFHFCFPFF